MSGSTGMITSPSIYSLAIAKTKPDPPAGIPAADAGGGKIPLKTAEPSKDAEVPRVSNGGGFV